MQRRGPIILSVLSLLLALALVVPWVAGTSIAVALDEPSTQQGRMRHIGVVRGRVGYFKLESWTRGKLASGARETHVSIPSWMPIATLSVIAGVCWTASRQGGRPGRCRSCGYDLRATPDRCPECGSVVLPPDLDERPTTSAEETVKTEADTAGQANHRAILTILRTSQPSGVIDVAARHNDHQP